MSEGHGGYIDFAPQRVRAQGFVGETTIFGAAIPAAMSAFGHTPFLVDAIA